MSASFEDKNRRLEFLSRIQPTESSLAKIIADKKLSRAGSYQRVWEWGDYVVKEVFSTEVVGFPKKKVSERRESMQQSKIRLEAHLQFLRTTFSDLYPRARCFVVKDKGNFRLFKVQRNLRKLEQYGPPNHLSAGNDATLLWVLRDEKNTKLREDFKKLYGGWRFLRDNGVSLDLTFSNNVALCYEGEGSNKILRLKVYDSIPLVLLDRDAFEKSSLPRNLILVPATNMDNRNPQNIEKFWHFIEDWHNRVLPTYGTAT